MNERGRDTPWNVRRALRWHETNTFTTERLPSLDEIVQRKRAAGSRVSVGIPALNEEKTIGGICRVIVRDLMDRCGLVDQLVVLEGGSEDDTAARARDAGAEVVDTRVLLPEVPSVRGKGESLWRSLAVLDGDLIVWVDADIRNFDHRFVSSLVAPLLADEGLMFVKGFYRRPIEREGRLYPSGGGRVTELLARPMLAAMFPELTGFNQPLSGEYAGRREALMRIPFFSGYSVEVGLLIDLLGTVGLEAMAQADLIERVHRNRPLTDLGPMAYAIGGTIMRRAEAWGRVRFPGDLDRTFLLPDEEGLSERVIQEEERPPMLSHLARATAAR